MALSVMAAFAVYAYELPAREYSCNRQIYIDLDNGTSEAYVLDGSGRSVTAVNIVKENGLMV